MDPDRKKTADSLRSVAHRIAQDAAQAMAGAARQGGASAVEREGTGRIDPHDPSAGIAPVQPPDEDIAMLEEDFGRLGRVVSLALQVDEPDLVADHLQWFDNLYAHRSPTWNSGWVGRLVGSYREACRAHLPDDSYQVVSTLLDRATSGTWQSTDPPLVPRRIPPLEADIP